METAIDTRKQVARLGQPVPMTRGEIQTLAHATYLGGTNKIAVALQLTGYEHEDMRKVARALLRKPAGVKAPDTAYEGSAAVPFRTQGEDMMC